ncbi:MAG: TPM domain-containing protein [Patescibacteria group bacterium]|nr:TPM domain-containing protein [Patescibacteria group bacterium]
MNKTGIIFFILIVGLAGLGLFLSIGDVSTENQGTITTRNVTALPEPTNYAVDAAGVLTTEQLNNLNELLKSYSEGYGQEIAIVIVKSTKPLEMEQYSIKLAEKWKVGNAKLDNGAIIVLATEDREVRLEIGYGLEENIPDSKAGRIIDDKMIPYLKSADWYNAVLYGAQGVFEASQ